MFIHRNGKLFDFFKMPTLKTGKNNCIDEKNLEKLHSIPLQKIHVKTSFAQLIKLLIKNQAI